MNAWGEQANVALAETKGVGEVRIARLKSPADMACYWSYVGTEILEIEELQVLESLARLIQRNEMARYNFTLVLGCDKVDQMTFIALSGPRTPFFDVILCDPQL